MIDRESTRVISVDHLLLNHLIEEGDYGRRYIEQNVAKSRQHCNESNVLDTFRYIGARVITSVCILAVAMLLSMYLRP